MPSVREYTAVLGTGIGCRTRSRDAALLLPTCCVEPRRYAVSARLGMVSSPMYGLARVMTCWTRSGFRRASSRARMPPRLQPTSDTGCPVRSATCSSRRGSPSTTSRVGPRLRPRPQPYTRWSSRRRKPRSGLVLMSSASRPGRTSTPRPSPRGAPFSRVRASGSRAREIAPRSGSVTNHRSAGGRDIALGRGHEGQTTMRKAVEGENQSAGSARWCTGCGSWQARRRQRDERSGEFMSDQGSGARIPQVPRRGPIRWPVAGQPAHRRHSGSGSSRLA